MGLCIMARDAFADRVRMGGRFGGTELGAALGVDRKCLPAVSRFRKRRRSDWGIQRQIHDQLHGVAWRVDCDLTRSQPCDLSEFLPPADAVAVHGYSAGEATLGDEFVIEFLPRSYAHQSVVKASIASNCQLPLSGDSSYG